MRKLLLITILLFLAGAIGFYGLLQGWHIERLAPDELERFLATDYETYVPEGDGPFPTVVGYHGCSGTLHGARDWARVLNEEGYAVVLVESIKPRNLGWREVCAGKKLWGSERAGDVMVSLQSVRQMPFVDPGQLHLFGWSHGGWSLMDTFAIAAKGQRPPNLDQLPENTSGNVLDGVLSATLFYPFCDFPVRARNGWPQTFPVHFVFAETDSIVSNASCQTIVDKQVSAGLPATATTYPDTDHAFDMRDEDFYDCCLKQQHQATSAAYAELTGLLKSWSPSPD